MRSHHRVEGASTTGVSAAARATLRTHLIATAGVLLAVLGAMLLVEWILTTQQADRIAERASSRIAESVLTPLRAMDFGDDELDTEPLDAQLSGFFDSGAVERIKVWRVEGETVRVVYSDLDDVVGDVRDFSPELAARLDAGETVVLAVPNDTEHRFERILPLDLREAFIGFTDAAGNEMRLEVYLPVHRRQMISGALSLQVPVVVGGLLALLIILLPLSIRLVRRLRVLGGEHERALTFGQRAREQERADLARRLHDDVIQSLAGARLALTSLEQTAPRNESAVLQRVNGVLADSTTTLRGMLTEFVPGAVTALTIEQDLADLVQRELTVRLTAGAGPSLRYLPPTAAAREQISRIDDGDALVLFRAAQEGLRNALNHARAKSVQLSLDARAMVRGECEVMVSVVDDGIGVDADASRRSDRDDHFGIELVRRSLEAVGGRLLVEERDRNEPGVSGTVFSAWLPVTEK